MPHEWVNELPVAVTVCDERGRVVAQNRRSEATFVATNGGRLLGYELFDCHPPAAASQLRELLTTPRTNAYTIEKGGVHKLIYQTPWYRDGVFAGLVELSCVIPAELPHFVRDPAPPASAENPQKD